MNELTNVEENRLCELEYTIHNGIQTFIEVGNALAEIRDGRLYRQDHETFESYCLDKWSMERRHAYRLMDSARAVNNVSHGTQALELSPPLNERQARPLTRFNDNPDLQQEIWETAVNTAPNGKMTAKHVEETVMEYKQPLTASNHNISQSADYDGDEWFTPPKFVDMSRSVMGSIDLDPATCEAAQSVHGIKNIFTKETNGLEKDWFGNVFVNPPYSVNLIKQFTEKCISEYEIGNAKQIILLTNNSSETGWFQSMLCQYPVCFPSSRISFWRPNHEAFGTRQGQAFFYFGQNVEQFKNVFSQIGCVVMSL